MPEPFSIKDYSPDELSYLAVLMAIAFSKGFDPDTLNVLSSFVFSIGGTLALIAKQELLLESLTPPKEPSPRASQKPPDTCKPLETVPENKQPYSRPE